MLEWLALHAGGFSDAGAGLSVGSGSGKMDDRQSSMGRGDWFLMQAKATSDTGTPG